jgi:hypothetical protein
MYNKIDIEYIEIKYALIEIFMINAQKYILDISYEMEDNNLIIQAVLLEESIFPEIIRQKLSCAFPKYHIDIKLLFISEQKFNSNPGEWNPRYYNWLSYLLFVKAST